MRQQTVKALLVLAVAGVAAGCASIPNGPDVMALPGRGMSFEQFQADDALVEVDHRVHVVYL